MAMLTKPLQLLGLASLVLSSVAEAILIPPPTGPFHVGRTRRTIHHINNHDPLAPNNVSTAFLATIIYPTKQEPRGPPQPYLWPGLAQFYEDRWNYSSGFLQSLTSVVQEDAPFLEGEVGKSPYPTLLFGSAGGGPPVDGNMILLSELASHGYTIIGLDHPFDQPYLLFPNGTAVIGTGWDAYYTGPQIVPIFEMRLNDTSVLVHRLDDFICELQAPINSTLVGALGFSLGGAAAIGSAYNISLIKSALNMDGTMYDRAAANTSQTDVGKPVFLFGHNEHLYDAALKEGDKSWGTFPLWQSDLRFMLVSNSTELDFFDNTFWRLIEPNPRLGGTIYPLRMLNITNAYVKAFFDLTLLGEDSPIMNGPSAEYPEVRWYYKNGTQYGSS
ncbi:hypothetical protein F5Y16DRAFT_119406 [Xylariaceae sp. FL0255]|nr:hypothetical protein F5Y16DRAFT_119406 [Xylariaceae sp. FL0255]